MSFLITKANIKLSQQTRNAWKSAGGSFVKATRTPAEINEIASRGEWEFLLNLGTQLTSEDIVAIPIVGDAARLQSLWTPGSTRRAIGRFLPPTPEVGNTDWWLKGSGYRGNNKHRMTLDYQGVPDRSQHWDAQVHIEGTEYRIITVGYNLTQRFQRHGSNSERSYTQPAWRDIPSAIKDIAYEAARAIGDEQGIVAWDTILQTITGNAYILEGNTCPGVKEYTAAKIVKAIRRQLDAE